MRIGRTRRDRARAQPWKAVGARQRAAPIADGGDAGGRLAGDGADLSFRGCFRGRWPKA
jgi:hypothetical protein